VKTWAPKGQTPVLQYSFNWRQLSLIAGVSFWQLYFRFFHGATKAPQLVEFLQALASRMKGKLPIVWDGLPAYAPELNPVEYAFGYAKQRELANLCLHTIGEVKRYASRRFRSMQRRPALITVFWKQAELAI